MSRVHRLTRWHSRVSSRIRHSAYRRWYRSKQALMTPADKLMRWFSKMSIRIRHSAYRRWYRSKQALMTPADNLMRWFSKMSIRIRSGYRDHAFHLVGLAVLCSILAASVFVVVASLGRNGEQGAGTTASPRSAPGSPQTPGQRGALTFTNLSGGYAFTYPRTWTVEKKGAATELASPDGETVVSFGSGGTPQVGGGGGDHPGSQGLLRTLGTAVDPSVLETAWQQVAGERSLLVSGTADDPTGRSIRFLVIAIPGERPTNTISIAVAAHSAPSRMLPRLERIVASFDILDDESSTEEIALPQA